MHVYNVFKSLFILSLNDLSENLKSNPCENKMKALQRC